jgi:hypothetical protein
LERERGVLFLFIQFLSYARSCSKIVEASNDLGLGRQAVGDVERADVEFEDMG